MGTDGFRADDLCHGGNGCHRGGSSRGCGQVDLGVDLTGGASLLRAVAGDVTGLATAVAGLASSVKRAAVGSGAVSRDVAELTAGIALHSLSLAITGEVVRATALVAGSRTGTASESTTSTKATSKTATAHRSTTAHRADGVGASALSKCQFILPTLSLVRCTHSKMTGLPAVVAAAAGSVAAQAQSRAIGLNVAKTLAVVALLGLSGSRERAAIGLVARLLAYAKVLDPGNTRLFQIAQSQPKTKSVLGSIRTVIAKTLSRGADLGVVADIATLVAGTTRQRRHFEKCLVVCEVTISQQL